MARLTRLDPVKLLVEAYTARPSDAALTDQIDYLAWAAFHDPWEIPPKKPKRPRKLPDDEGPVNPVIPAPRGNRTTAQKRIPLDEGDVEPLSSSQTEVDPKGLELVKQALGQIEVSFTERGGNLYFKPLRQDEAHPQPLFRVRYFPGRSQMLSIKAVWRINPSEMSFEKALFQSNRYNRVHRNSQVVVMEPTPSDPGVQLVLRCYLELKDGFSAAQLGIRLRRMRIDLDGFWTLLQVDIQKGQGL